ncbi:hypothetical protein FRZ44_09480 [Hypericibacter terrae]|uniref:Uncharacterized protein n=1 Tax=Hypericibacter terrae TaxID=2602015 RepID=A0A5J6MET1_9PROT|nr:hypothetical protein [Hypericibacter terrae]QEX15661.1 hypothetical protein FRZ44_09480 [Hypericibacter terrae]
MWPFNRKKPGAEEGLRNLASYVSFEAVKALASGSSGAALFESGEIPFVLLQVRDDKAEDVGPRLARAMTKVRDSGGMIHMMSSLMLVFFGFPRSAWASVPERPSIENGRRLSAALLQELGADAKILYGTATGLVGNLGGPHYMHYAAAIPGFGALTAKLVQIEFGRAEAI